jgi:predicted nuclease of predicted toxin-antitoxin system
LRFLLDECVSARLTGLLVDAGHDCVHVQDRELRGAVDEDVMAAAVAESRVLVSMDTDFGELLATSNARLPSVVLFRRVGRTAEEQAAVLLLNLPDIIDDLESGAIAVITDSQIRLRRLPLRPQPPA